MSTPCSHAWETDDKVCPECGTDWTAYFRGGPDTDTRAEPMTEAGRATVIRRAHQNGIDLLDEGAMAVLAQDILAIEREAIAKEHERLQWLVNHSTPQHSAACASQDPDDPCFCGVSDEYERILALLKEP